MNLRYIFARSVRHFMPDAWARYLLRRGLVIRPGQETSDPQSALRRYEESLAARGTSFSGKRVMIFGYGGSFAVGCGLLELGARHVVLCDRYAPPDDRLNESLLPKYSAYVARENGQITPRAEYLSVLNEDIREVKPSRDEAKFDMILSTCVYEHLDDAEGVTGALASWTSSLGLNLHLIDLRDHYFKYPFEMLCYSESTWKTWLNPGSNLNRFRLQDYRKAFERHFTELDIQVVSRDEEAFNNALPRIRPEFLTGDIVIDAVTMIQVTASNGNKPTTGGQEL